MPRSEADSGRSAARAQQTRNPKMRRLCWLCLRPPDIHATAVHRTTLVDTLPHLTIYLQTAARKPALLENRTGVLLGLIRLGFFTTHCSCCGALVIQVRGTECDFRLRVSCMLLNCIEPDQRHSQLLPGPGDTPGSKGPPHAGTLARWLWLCSETGALMLTSSGPRPRPAQKSTAEQRGAYARDWKLEARFRAL